MKSITIHKLDSELANAIQKIAKKTGLSQNKVVKKLLREALNLSDKPTPKSDFSEFCGIWTKEETEEFNEAMKDFEKIDKDMWE